LITATFVTVHVTQAYIKITQDTYMPTVENQKA